MNLFKERVEKELGALGFSMFDHRSAVAEGIFRVVDVYRKHLERESKQKKQDSFNF